MTDGRVEGRCSIMVGYCMMDLGSVELFSFGRVLYDGQDNVEIFYFTIIKNCMLSLKDDP